ncbi:hypothetical protein HJC23_000885 [Cyclotella cryptica]|uniref:tRNA-specific adenosine deaminase 1 n=1 Tax=Cyclotella cryptica TaxID=29204 RepID=A0ABD3PTX1_9STRA
MISSSSSPCNTSSNSSSNHTLPDRIAKCALHHYDHVLPSNTGGKPQSGREWTVYAAIVAVRSNVAKSRSIDAEDAADCSGGDEQDMLWVVSCATGSKCTSINSVASSLPSLQKRDDNLSDHGIGQDERDHMIVQSYKGMILKDSHAEVLARRGLMAVLWSEIEMTLTNIQKTQTCIDTESISMTTKDRTSTNLLEILPTVTNNLGFIQFRLRSDVTLHMYISDSPCGDATIYEIKKLKYAARNDREDDCNEDCESKDAAPEFETEINFTGAKIILTGNGDTEYAQPTQSSQQHGSSSISSIITFSNENGVEQCNASHHSSSTITVGREHVQMLGALRIKSSRSNIPPHLRSTSMSCSDKLVRWGVLGMQGSLLTLFIPDPICLSSVCVSRDPRSVDSVYGGQLRALDRALRERIESVLNIMKRNQRCMGVEAPAIAIVDMCYDRSKSASEYRHMMVQYSGRKRSLGAVGNEEPPTQSNKKTKLCNKGGEISPMDQPPAEHLPTPHLEQKKSQHSHVQQGIPQSSKKESPSGMSINWHQRYQSNATLTKKEDNFEVTIGATGLKRGKKPKQPNDVIKSASRLCRYNLFDRWRKCLELSIPTIRCYVKDVEKAAFHARTLRELLHNPTSYMESKQKLYDLGLARIPECLFSKREDGCAGPLGGWIRNGVRDDFGTIAHMTKDLQNAQL